MSNGFSKHFAMHFGDWKVNTLFIKSENYLCPPQPLGPPTRETTFVVRGRTVRTNGAAGAIWPKHGQLRRRPGGADRRAVCVWLTGVSSPAGSQMQAGGRVSAGWSKGVPLRGVSKDCCWAGGGNGAAGPVPHPEVVAPSGSGGAEVPIKAPHPS